MGRVAHPGKPGPYTWWSFRGKAFDTNAGWRIDYQLATPKLASLGQNYRVDRAKSYDERWTDHSPVLVDYKLEVKK
jgi:exodeoxyribonuclease-3